MLSGFVVDSCLHMVEDFTRAHAQRSHKIAVYTMSLTIRQARLAKPLSLDSNDTAFSAGVGDVILG